MKNSMKALVAGAALAGLLSGTAVKVNASTDAAGKNAQGSTTLTDKNSCTSKDGCSGKHDCKGKNSCKGQGGCKSGDNGCKGQNSCKGNGGCSTKKSTKSSDQ